jgi:hypothetical protein
MVTIRLSLRRIAIGAVSIALAGTFARPALAQGPDRELFTKAEALEQAARIPLNDPNAPADTSLDEIHTAVAAYLLVPKRFPASGYSDDALWRAGRLSLDAFAHFGSSGDKESGQRLLKRLAAGYPASSCETRTGRARDLETPPSPSASLPPQRRSRCAAGRLCSGHPGDARVSAARGARGTSPTATIRSIRRSDLPDAVRIIIELDGGRVHERIADPDRDCVTCRLPRCGASLLDQTLVQQRRRRRSADPPSAATRAPPVARRAGGVRPTASTRSTTPTGWS